MYGDLMQMGEGLTKTWMDGSSSAILQQQQGNLNDKHDFTAARTTLQWCSERNADYTDNCQHQKWAINTHPYVTLISQVLRHHMYKVCINDPDRWIKCLYPFNKRRRQKRMIEI